MQQFVVVDFTHAGDRNGRGEDKNLKCSYKILSSLYSKKETKYDVIRSKLEGSDVVLNG